MLKLLVATFVVINLVEADKHERRVFENLLRVIEEKEIHEHVKTLGKVLFLYRTAPENTAFCMPKVFQMKQYVPGPAAGYTVWHYFDADNSRVALHGMNPDGSFFWSIVLFHPQNHTVDDYEFNGDRCVHHVYKGDYVHPCYPPNSTIKGKFTVGVAPEGTTNVLYLESRMQDEMMQWLVTAQNYIPISGAITGPGPDSCMTSYYSDVQLNIFDPSVFTPPVKCNDTKLEFD